VVITGCDRMELLDQAIQAAASFKPLTRAQKSTLLARTRDAALTGRYEPFQNHHGVRRNGPESGLDGIVLLTQPILRATILHEV